MPIRDLSRPIEDGMQPFPEDEPATVERVATVERDGYETRRLTLSSHAGTHVDAPSHMLADGQTIEDIPLETFRFDARVVDCRPLDTREPIDRERLLGAAPDPATDLEAADLVVIRTGWASHWGTDRYFDHPFPTADAADAIVERGCHLAVDAPNVDPTPTENAGRDEPDGHPVHRALFEADRVILENLRGLDAVPDRFELRAYPLAIREGDGSPVRAVAVLE